MIFKKALLGLGLLAVAGAGQAQIFENDLLVSFAPTLTKYKSKKGTVQMSVLAITAYFTTNIDINSVKKLKANASLAFYLSSDQFASNDDVLMATAEITNLKMLRAKKSKVTIPVTDANKGQYLLVTLTSAQDEWDINNLSFVEIPHDAF